MAVARALVLVVDDSPEMRRLLAGIVRAMGCRVIEAADGLEALDRLKSSRPHLMITDLSMPRMDGFTLLREIRDRDLAGGMSILVCSSDSGPDTRDAVFLLGARGLIDKAALSGRLRKAVEGLLLEAGAGRNSPATALPLAGVVLLVCSEGEPAARTESWLHEDGYRVIRTSGAREALELVRAGGLPALALVDASDPRMLELVRELRDASRGRCRILALYMTLDAAAVIECARAGIDHCLVGTFSREALRDRLRELGPG
jgi:two-component system chemotaxis response regulator CheY